MDVVCNSLQRVEVLDFVKRVTGLLQERLVGDDTIGLIDPAYSLGLAGFVDQVEVVCGQLIHEISAVQCQAIVFPVLQRAHVTYIKERWRLRLSHLCLLSIAIGSGRSSYDLAWNTCLLCISFSKSLKCFICFRLIVQPVYGTGAVIASGVTSAATAGCESKYHRERKEKNK